MNRVWDVTSVEAKKFPTLEKDSTADVVIVGAGITGLTAALKLLDEGYSVAVIESKQVASGDTGGSTGNLYAITTQSLANVRQTWGEQGAKDFVSSRMKALIYIQDTVERFNIHCQFKRQPLYFCATELSVQLAQQFDQELQASKVAGLDAQWATSVPLPITMEKALKIEAQAQFNPVAYLRVIAAEVQHKGGAIYEHTRAQDVVGRKGIIKTEQGNQIKAKHIVLATHTPVGINLLQTEMEPLLEHGISARLKGGPYPEGIFWIADGFFSVRSYHSNGDHYLVVVGAKHKTGHTDFGGQYYENLRAFARTHFDVDRFEHCWSAQQFRSADYLPYIGRAPMAGNVYVGTGYAADGLVWGTLAGMMITDIIAERDNQWVERFNPQRFTPRKSARAFLKQNVSVMKHYVTGYLRPTPCKEIEAVGQDQGKIVSFNGEDLAVYRDTNNQVTALSAICTHMKCKVRWNAADKTWDCPCHGSRFDIDGSVLEGPALHPLRQRPLPEKV